jgi:hypothetical protein
MSNEIKRYLAVFGLVTLLSAAVHSAEIGNWEGTPDGCIDWGNKESIDSAANMPVKYQYASIGATLGSQSLKVIQSGWGQSLAFRLNAAQRQAFMSNSVFKMDMSVAANDGTVTGGYTQIHSVYMNAEGPGWTTVADGTPINFYWWSGSGQRTQTLEIDYTNFRNAITNPGLIEIVFALNTGGGAPPEMYFDNARVAGGLGFIRQYEEEITADHPRLWIRFETDQSVDSSEYNRYVEFQSENSNGVGSHPIVGDGIGNCRYLENHSNNSVAASVKTANISWGGTFGNEFAFVDNGDAIPDDDITFEFWFKTEPNLMQQYAVFFQQVEADYAKAPGLANSDGYFRVLTGNPTSSDPNATQFWWYTPVETPADGQWHHVVLAYDESYNGDVNQMQIRLFLDGTLRASTVVGSAEWPAKLGPELDHLVIGGRNNRGYTYAPPERYEGFIDEFAIYAGILSEDRVLAHYASGFCTMSRGDINGDCKVDMLDFAEIASTWLVCNDPMLFGSDPACGPTWQ